MICWFYRNAKKERNNSPHAQYITEEDTDHHPDRWTLPEACIDNDVARWVKITVNGIKCNLVGVAQMIYNAIKNPNRFNGLLLFLGVNTRISKIKSQRSVTNVN